VLPFVDEDDPVLDSLKEESNSSEDDPLPYPYNKLGPERSRELRLHLKKLEKEESFKLNPTISFSSKIGAARRLTYNPATSGDIY